MLNFKDQSFGLELEFTGITRENACKAISKVVAGGAAPYYKDGAYRAWTVQDQQGRTWTVERDSSVQPDGGERCEFVTPKCNYADIPTVQECIRALRRAGAKVNTSCGMHIHVDAANHTAKSLKNLLFTFRAKEDLIFKAVGTQSNRLAQWCKPIDDTLVDRVKKIKKLDGNTLKETWYSTYAQSWEIQDAHYNSSRYHALNLHSVYFRGTVEFRLFEATLHAGEARAYINLCLAMSAQAINSKRASAEVLDNGNDKYAMRCWLLRLGFIGDEYKTIREHLLKRLSGNAAWRNDPNTYESYNNRRRSSRNDVAESA